MSPEAVGAEPQTLLCQSYRPSPLLGRTWVRYIWSISEAEKQKDFADTLNERNTRIDFSQRFELKS